MITCTVKLQFSAAKRLTNYDGKCNQLHGYGHIIEATFSGNEEGSIVVDFYHLKEVLGNWVDDNWDHNVILNKSDQALGEAIAKETKQNIFYLEDDPTAENMASYLKNEICPSLFKDAKCTKIRLYDHSDCWVEI